MTPVRSRRDARDFLMLPESLYRDEPNWCPPLWAADAALLDRERHPFHAHAEVEYFLAPGAGRVAAILNHAHNDFHRERIGFFGFFDCVDDPAVAGGLLSAAEEWLRARGCTAVRGPCNFSTNETCGQLVDGFDTPPYILTTWHPPYTARRIEAAGYRGVKDLLGYQLHKAHSHEERFNRVAELIRRRLNVRLRPMKVRRFHEEIQIIHDVYNSGWERNWGFVPMTGPEIEWMARDLKPLVLPHLCTVAEVDGRPIGFALAIPDVNRIIKEIGGRLWPLGWRRLLSGIKAIDTCRVVALGSRPEFQATGLGALFYLNLLDKAPAGGVPGGELSWILEDNVPMNKAAVEMGARFSKRWRIYERAL